MMLQKVLETGTSGTTFVVMALVLFFSVFMSVLVREILRPRREVARMADMPLEEEEAPAKMQDKGLNQ
jgi:hypothetical protein